MIRLDVEREVSTLLAECSDDELRVVHRMLKRVHRARREYGPLRIKTDTRDYRKEAADEAWDGMFYLCLEEVRRGVQEPRFQGGIEGRALKPGDMLPGAKVSVCAHEVAILDPCVWCLAMQGKYAWHCRVCDERGVAGTLHICRPTYEAATKVRDAIAARKG